MDTVIGEMLSKYGAKGRHEEELALKEVVQEAILLGLYKGGFFKVAAFYGGTSLRIFHGLDRFSEDLDFSLLSPDPGFSWERYFPSIERELESLGLSFSLSQKSKKRDTAVKSAFAKGNLRKLILDFYPGDRLSIHPDQSLSIKFEADALPPEGAKTETRYRLLPSYYGARIFTLPCLFAGKIAALLTRSYSNRVKGRDFYDYLFYLSKGAKADLSYLSSVLRHSGFIEDGKISLEELKKMLRVRFDEVDYKMAREDVSSFIRDPSSLDIWDASFFKGVTDSYLAAE